jgi:hypothetical protein
MRPTVVSVTGTGVSVPIPVDIYANPTAVGLGVTVTGTVNYTVQYTFDDVFADGYDPATGNWVDHPSLTAQTVTKDSNLAYPARALRIKANSGAGSSRLTVIQAGNGGLGA